jgi:hypothetical protein
MKKETIEKIMDIIEKEGNGSSVLIAVKNIDDEIVTMLSGDSAEIASSIFFNMYNKRDSAHANKLYGVIKNVVYNMARLVSPMSNDLFACIDEMRKKDGK